jgi:hypothetical protein
MIFNTAANDDKKLATKHSLFFKKISSSMLLAYYE